MAKIPQSQLEEIVKLQKQLNDLSEQVAIAENQVSARLRNGDTVVAGLLKAYFKPGTQRLIVELA